jgi:hypothetical protein
MRSTIGIIVFALSLLCCCTSALSREAGSQEFKLSDLKSTDVQKRMTAYDKIKNHPEVLRRPEVKAALIDLLDRENTYHATPPKATGVTSEGDDWEGYGDYWMDVAETVGGIADWHDPRQLCILARSPYDPLSNFSQKLAADGGALVAPCLLTLARGNQADRYQSLSVLVMVLALNKDLPPDVRQRINHAILTGLGDRETIVRETTITTIGKFGKSEMIPVLENIARTDPYSHLVNGKPVFDVRDAAVKAIHSIQERVKVGSL